MTDTTHECPEPDCERRVPFERLACKQHWYAIPPLLRGRLLREYAECFGERSYFEARAECLSALGVPDEEIPDLNGGIGRREAVAR